MIKFATRSAARSFKSKNAKFKVVDLGSDVAGARWGVKVL